MHTTDYDIAIVGGGLVGMSLAIALGRLRTPPRVALIEAHDYAQLPPPGFDSRTIALSYSSRQIFEGLQLWPALNEKGVTPIETIHISDRGHPGMTRLQAREQHVEALGYVVENRVLGEVLYACLQQMPHVTLHTRAELQDVTIQPTQVQLAGSQADKAFALTCRLLVAADGTNSFVRQHLGIAQQYRDYHQSAVIANVATDMPHNNIAYERFTESGPMALLPLNGITDAPHRYGLVWTVPQDKVESVLQLDEQAFSAQLCQRFGMRAGNFMRIGQRHAYPLGLAQISEHVRPRLAFIGNAAHTLHPVAGQGFNLGLRDVAALSQVIADTLSAQQDPGELQRLQAYASWRRKDLLTTTLFTDSLVRIFSTDFLPLVLARNAGLLAMDLFAPLRKRLTRHAMGYIGRASLLARGLGL